MPERRVDIRLLGHADQVEELERRVREATDARGEEHYRHVRPDAGDALISVVYITETQPEAERQARELLHALRVAELGVEHKDITIGISGWPEATT